MRGYGVGGSCRNYSNVEGIFVENVEYFNIYDCSVQSFDPACIKIQGVCYFSVISHCYIIGVMTYGIHLDDNVTGDPNSVFIEYCNFTCSYCRGLKDSIYGDREHKQLSLEEVKHNIDLWCSNEPLENIRFSGGEPTLHKDIV